MTQALFTAPPTFALPVSYGADIIVTFLNQVPNSNPPTYQDFPVGTTVTLSIGKPDAIVAQSHAVIDGSAALCRIPYASADLIKNGSLWRCIITLPDPDGVGTDHIVAMNGTVVRSDGN